MNVLMKVNVDCVETGVINFRTLKMSKIIGNAEQRISKSISKYTISITKSHLQNSKPNSGH